MKKTTTKTTKNKAEVWFDMSDGTYDVNDIVARITIAKINAGLPITESQLNNIINFTANEVLASLFSWNNAVMHTNNGYVKLNLNVLKTTQEGNKPVEEKEGLKETPETTEDEPVVKKKPNIFKRIWNFITGKK